MHTGAVLFYIFSALILLFGVLTVTSRKLFRTAIYLLGALVNTAAIYFLFKYEFIAVVQIIVYVGGIVVLILFSIFLTHHSGSDLAIPSWRKMIFTGATVLGASAMTLFMLHDYSFDKNLLPAPSPSISEIGREMLNIKTQGYSLPFEVISVLLLAAMIGCIVVAFKVKSHE